VTDMHDMFDNAESFNQDLTSWDINPVILDIIGKEDHDGNIERNYMFNESNMDVNNYPIRNAIINRNKRIMQTMIDDIEDSEDNQRKVKALQTVFNVFNSDGNKNSFYYGGKKKSKSKRKSLKKNSKSKRRKSLKKKQRKTKRKGRR